MISFREYLVREGRDDLKSRLSKHVKHHNTCKALEDAFPGEELDKAKEKIYTGKKWNKKSEKLSLAKFRDDSDKKWADLWSAMTADMRKD